MTRIRNAGDLDFCDFSERFLTDEQGRPLVIESFQRQVLAASRRRPRDGRPALGRR